MIACLLSTGFTVERDHASGLDRIADELRRVLPQGSYVYRGKHNEDWAEIARSRPVQSADTVALVDHSYGFPAHVNFCEAYAPKRVALMCVIDGVPRAWTNPVKAFLGLLVNRPIGTIKVPPNVDRCIYWRQLVDAPYGRPITLGKDWTPPATGHFDRPIGHVYFPDSPSALASARKHLRPWETIRPCRSPPNHNEIDSWPSVRREVIEAVTAL